MLILATTLFSSLKNLANINAYSLITKDFLCWSFLPWLLQRMTRPNLAVARKEAPIVLASQK